MLATGRLTHDPARCEIDRELLIYRIAALAPLRDLKMAFPIRMKRDAAFDQTRRARMVEADLGLAARLK